MIPKLHDRNEQYIGELPNCLKGIAIEKRNGMLEAEITYPIFSPNWNKLVRGNIIIADTNDTLKNQKFRIYKVSKPINGKINVYAKHISYSLGRDMIDGLDITNQSCEYCLNEVFRNSQFSRKFRGHSDIINAQDFKIGATHCLTAIGGTEGSILDTFGTGAEILRDNEDIYVLNRRGHDNGVTIEYGINLTGLDVDEDETGMITRIRAVARYTPEGGEEVTVHCYVDSPRILDYEEPFIVEIDFTDKLKDGEVPTIAKLQTLGERYFRDNNCDIPKCTYKINFIPLSKCVGYENLNDKISLCDTATIKDHRYGIDTQAKVITATYDFLRERYDSMELGEPKTTLGDLIGSGGNNQGPPGKPGPPGPPGADGDIGDFPDSLPQVPNLQANVYSFNSISLDWTYESKVYYEYELYASKVKDFKPNVFDLVFKGQASTFLHQVKPGETWYYRCRAVNTHGNATELSSQIVAQTRKIDDMNNYFDEAAIGRAVVGSLTADYMEAGIIKGHWIDAKQLSVTDGNGKRTLDIDSYGNVNLDVNNLSIRSKDVEGELAVNMIPNSNFSASTKVQGWHFWQSDYSSNGCSWYKDQHGDFPQGEGLGISSDLNQLCTATSEQVFVEYGEYYTLSIDKLNVEQNVTNSRVMIRCLAQDNTIVKELVWNYGVGYHRDIVHTIQIDDNRIKKINVLIWNDGATVSNKEYVVVFFNRLQFQKGKIRTPWKLSTTDSLIQNIADIRVEATGIKQTVEHINGDYASKSTVTQLDNKVEYKFENSGKFNMIRNSVFTKGLKGWENLDCAMAYGFSGCPVDIGVLLDDCSEHNQTRYIWQRLDIRSDSVGAYTFSGYVWTNHSEFIEGEGKDYPMCNVYLTVTYKDDTYDWYNYDLRDNSRPQQWRKFKCTFVNQKPIKNIDFYIYKRNCTGVMYVTQLKGEEGWEASAWSPSSNEIYSNITTIDGEGIEISHDSGAKSRMTHEAVEFTASNGTKVLKIKDGGMNFFTWQNPEMVGFIKPSSLDFNRMYNGPSLSTYGAGDYISIGCSDSNDENSWATYPYILVCPRNIDSQYGYYEGVNLIKATNICHSINFKRSDTVYDSQIYASDGGILGMFGDNYSKIGFREGTANKTGLSIEEAPGWQNNCQLKLWGEFNFQNYKVHNFRATYNLEPKSIQAKDKMKREDRNLYTSYTTNQDEIRHSGKSTTFGNSTIVELPINIAENINNDYIVHLTKYGRGDIWIKEVNPYYFEVESDVGSIGFSYEVVATKLEEREIDSRMRIDYETTVEAPDGEEIVFEDVTEAKNNEYWKLYRKQNQSKD